MEENNQARLTAESTYLMRGFTNVGAEEEDAN